MNHLGTPVIFQTPVDFDLVFPVSKRAIAGVGCCWDFDVWMAFESEEIMQVGGETPDGTPASPVGELASLVSFFQEVFERVFKGEEFLLESEFI